MNLPGKKRTSDTRNSLEGHSSQFPDDTDEKTR